MLWIVSNVDVVNNVLSTQSVVNDLVLTRDMIDMIKEITTSLSQLRLAVTMLIEQDPPPLSVILPLLQRLYNSKLVVNDGDSTITRIIKETVMSGMKSLYDQESVMRLLKVATVLDPRFKSVRFLKSPNDAHTLVKMQALEVYNRMHNQNNKADLLPDLSEDINVIIKTEPDEEHGILVSLEEPDVKRVKMDNPSPHASSTSTVSSIEALNNSAMSIFFDDEGGREEPLTPEKTVENEFQRYLNEEKVPMVTNPYEWWTVNGSKYPLISVLAAKHLCIPACVKAPTNVFVQNTTQDTFARKRLSLSTHNVDLQLFLHANSRWLELWLFLYGICLLLQVFW